MDIYSIDQLATQYHQLDRTAKKTGLDACIVLATIQNQLITKHGSVKSKGYRQESRSLQSDLDIKKDQWSKDVMVGNWLLDPSNDPSQYKTKTDIYKAIKPSKPKAPKAPPAPTSTTIDPYWKECERKYMALMDYMGPKADGILAKALAAFG